MGALAGVLYRDGRQGDLSFLPRMLGAMARRGPTDEGYAVFSDPSSAPALFGGTATPQDVYRHPAVYAPRAPMSPEGQFGPACLAMGHRRLATMDPSAAGHQPMASPDGRFWIVTDGTVWNAAQIRSELERDGSVFRTVTDTEVMLEAYRRWGAAALNKFNGGFAMVIWDAQDRRLFAARDRMGLKPLYYYQGPDVFLFASQMDALLASGCVPRQVDPDGLYHALVLQMAPRPLTAIRGVNMLRNAHVLFVGKEGHVQERRYWSLPFGMTDHTRSEASYVEEFDAVLKHAVQQALTADVPVATYLSGGVDSTCVTALASQLQPGISAFTLSHEGHEDLDELRNARATAAMHDVALVEIRSGQGYTMAANPECARYLEEPWMSLHAGFLIPPAAAERGARVMLGASGVDQCFLGFPYERKLDAWRTCLRLRGLLTYLPPCGRLGSLRRWSRMQTLAEVYAYRLSWLSGTVLPEETGAIFTADFRAKVAEPNTGRLLESLYGFCEQRYEDAHQALCALDLQTFYSNRLLRDVDQENAYAGTEGRSVVLDLGFLEFLAKLPSEWKTRNGQRKYLMRKTAAPYIHPDCLAQGKQGLISPMCQWMSGPLKGFAHDKLQAAAQTGIFEPGSLRQLSTQLEAGQFDWKQAHKIWQHVSTQCWLEAFELTV